MAIEKLSINAFIELAMQHTILDVRSPGEFLHAHIPGASSLPLFTDEERAIVGTAYKQQSKQQAIKLGLGFFGGKMVNMVEFVEQHLKQTEDLDNRKVKELQPHKLLVHCWRGGMRSAGVAWLMSLYGFEVYTLVGGYKAFRNWVLQQFAKKYPFKILGGYTGSAKTEVLKNLVANGETVIDLEDLAHHKGSAFGYLTDDKQPSQEMFENRLAIALYKAANDLSNKGNEATACIWLEDESQRIGQVIIPQNIFNQIRHQPVIFLDIPFQARLAYSLKNYGSMEKDKIVQAIIRIKKRLGGLEAKTAINALLEEDLSGCFEVLLKYYDKLYHKGLHLRENVAQLVHFIQAETVDPLLNTQTVLQYKQKI